MGNAHIRPLVLDMVASRLALHPLLTRILIDLFSRCQVFNLTTLQTLVLISEIHYVMSLLNVDSEFPQLYVNMPFKYLASNITRNNCVAVRTCSDSYTSST